MWTFVASESQTYQKMNCPWQGNTLHIPHLKSPLLCLEWNTKSNVSPRWCIGPEIHWERLWHSWRSATWAAQERGKEGASRERHRVHWARTAPKVVSPTCCPPWFDGTMGGGDEDVWVPLTLGWWWAGLRSMSGRGLTDVQQVHFMSGGGGQRNAF